MAAVKTFFLVVADEIDCEDFPSVMTDCLNYDSFHSTQKEAEDDAERYMTDDEHYKIVKCTLEVLPGAFVEIERDREAAKTDDAYERMREQMHLLHPEPKEPHGDMGQ